MDKFDVREARRLQGRTAVITLILFSLVVFDFVLIPYSDLGNHIHILILYFFNSIHIATMAMLVAEVTCTSQRIKDGVFIGYLAVIMSDFVVFLVIELGIRSGLVAAAVLITVLLGIPYVYANWPKRDPLVDGYAPPGERIGKIMVQRGHRIELITPGDLIAPIDH
jgi:hypothetical protein